MTTSNSRVGLNLAQEAHCPPPSQIVIDECHRGSAAEDSAWREILDHFSAATQVGLTATSKEHGRK